MKKKLQARLQYARFLQETVGEMAREVKSTSTGEKKKTAEDLVAFMQKVRLQIPPKMSPWKVPKPSRSRGLRPRTRDGLLCGPFTNFPWIDGILLLVACPRACKSKSLVAFRGELPWVTSRRKSYSFVCLLRARSMSLLVTASWKLALASRPVRFRSSALCCVCD